MPPALTASRGTGGGNGGGARYGGGVAGGQGVIDPNGPRSGVVATWRDPNANQQFYHGEVQGRPEVARHPDRAAALLADVLSEILAAGPDRGRTARTPSQPSPLQGEGPSGHSDLHSRPLNGGGLGWG